MTNIETTTGTTDGRDLIPGTNVTWAEAAAMHKDYLRDQRCARILRGRGKKRSSNGSGRGFYVLAADGSIDKRATREQRLFGPNATPVADVADEVSSDWDGTFSLKADGSIDKQATRERRIFGEPEDIFDRSQFEFFGNEEGDADGGDGFHVLDENGCIDKEATRERRLFGSNRWN